MANILIDPVIVMSPANNASKEDVEAWLINLDLWLKDMTDLMLYRIVRTIAGIIADKPELLQHKPHPVREREEQHTPQLIRASDNATAWRITITHDGAGWRMHYWRKTDPSGNVTIEFSNVLTKKDPVVIY